MIFIQMILPFAKARSFKSSFFFLQGYHINIDELLKQASSPCLYLLCSMFFCHGSSNLHLFQLRQKEEDARLEDEVIFFIATS